MIKSRNMILILVAVLLVGAIAYFATATQTSVKSGADASAGGQPVTGTATPSPTPGQETTQSEFFAKHKELILGADSRISPEKLMPINNIPEEISLGQNLYLLNLVITEKGATGYIENRDNKWHNSDLKIFGFKNEGKFVFILDILSIDIEKTVFAVAPGQKYPLEIQQEATGLENTKFLAVLATVSS